MLRRTPILLALLGGAACSKTPTPQTQPPHRVSTRADAPPRLEMGEPEFHVEPGQGCDVGVEGHRFALVTKKRGQQLPCSYEPDDMVLLPRDVLVGRHRSRRNPQRLREDAAEALVRMIEGADNEGVKIRVASAFRSYDLQGRLFQQKIRKYGHEHASRFSAEPGRSQHQLGTAVDLTSGEIDYKLNSTFERTEAGLWLQENAHRYGFAMSYPDNQEHITGYAYEPWHFRFIGVEELLEMREQGLLLDDYLERCIEGRPGLVCTDGKVEMVASADEDSESST